MPTPHFNRERAAIILAEAEIVGVGKAAKNWGIYRKTVTNYRRRLKEDPDFARFYSTKKQEIARMWAKQVEEVMKECLAGIMERIPHLSLEDPQSVHVLAGAVKILGELKINAEVLHGSETDQN